MLKGKAQESRNPKNARDTATGLKHLDKWLGFEEMGCYSLQSWFARHDSELQRKNDRYVAANILKAIG